MTKDPVYREAIKRFLDRFENADQLGVNEPSAMSLATAGTTGRPSVRIVLLRGVDVRGFVFYTNSHSRKGQQLAENPWAALCFHWENWGQQVRVEGTVTELTQEENDTYWASRQRASQIGAWASDQSATLQEPSTLLDRVAQYEQQFRDAEVPRPPHWYGYRVVPVMIEFWQRRENRLHDRVLFESCDGIWHKRTLFP